MNFTLHWLRRDLRRHAPALALWALLFALFTWARIWLRTHPQFRIGDRDLWLSVPAAALGFAEVCLLLRVLLDDPARGPHAFWKTRPPSGGAVFAAKGIICGLAALVIPFAAEAVFLTAVGPSGGTPERVSLYLLPAVLALMAGTVTVGWKGVLLWLPVSIGILTAGATTLLWLIFSWRLEFPADHRLIATAVLFATVSGAVFSYCRRCAGKLHFAAVLAMPVAAGIAVAATGWPRDSRLLTPPPNIQAEDIRIVWHQAPRVSRDYQNQQWGMSLLLRVEGLPSGTTADAIVQEMTLTCDGVHIAPRPPMERYRLVHNYLGKPGAYFNVLLTGEEAAVLRERPWTATGTLSLRIFDRTPHSLALDRIHTVETADCRWVITPAVPGGDRRRGYSWDGEASGIWCEFDFMNLRPLPDWDLSYHAFNSTFLRHTADNRSRPQMNARFGKWMNLWEGTGRGGFRLEMSREEAAELRDPATWKNWTLDFNTLTLAGTLEVPFMLHWPETK